MRASVTDNTNANTERLRMSKRAARYRVTAWLSARHRRQNLRELQALRYKRVVLAKKNEIAVLDRESLVKGRIIGWAADFGELLLDGDVCRLGGKHGRSTRYVQKCAMFSSGIKHAHGLQAIA